MFSTFFKKMFSKENLHEIFLMIYPKINIKEEIIVVLSIEIFKSKNVALKKNIKT